LIRHFNRFVFDRVEKLLEDIERNGRLDAVWAGDERGIASKEIALPDERPNWHRKICVAEDQSQVGHGQMDCFFESKFR
jgi:hypothetical protein